MKRLFFLTVAIGLVTSACGTAAAPVSVPTPALVNPSPINPADLNATAAAMAQQTLAAMPTNTEPPSATPVPPTETPTETPSPTFTATQEAFTLAETQNPILLTLTATLGTGTPDEATPFLPAPALPTSTPDLTTPTETPYPRTYGTMPPNAPAGKVYIFNKAKTEATISLHCTTKEGYTAYIEYPVNGSLKIKVPAGYYSFVVWVNGKVYRGNFKLQEGGEAAVTIYKDHVEAK